jgi:hypothetical protein
MNARILDLMRRLASLGVGVLLGLGTAACSDTSLAVEVIHDPDYASQVTKTVVSVYESSTITCPAIEFGDIGDLALGAALVSEAEVTKGSLAGLSRTDPKIIVARGYAADGTLLTAGCVAKGLISGSDVVKVNTVVTVTASLVFQGQGTDTPYQIQINTSDPNGDPISGRAISWQVDAAAGTTPGADGTQRIGDATSPPAWQPARPSCTKNNGNIQVHPVPPAQIGGYRVRPRVSWAVAQPPPYSQFTPLPTTDYKSLSLLGPATTRPCAIRRTGTNPGTVVCLAADSGGGTVATEYAVTLGAGTVSTTPSNSSPLVGIDWLGVISTKIGANQVVYAVTTRGRWVSLFGAPAPTGPLPFLSGAEVADDMMVMPACGTAPAALVLRVNTPGGNTVKAMAIGGSSPIDLGISSPPLVPLTLNGAGCVAELASSGTPNLRQVVVVNSTSKGAPITRAYFPCAGGSCQVTLPLAEAAVGFIAGDEPQLVGSNFDASGALLTTWVLRSSPGANGDRLVERVRFPAAAPPQVLAIGSFDGDATPDFVWAFAGRRSANIQLAYGRQVDGAPLSAFSSLPAVTEVTDILVGNLTGDGADDLVVVGKALTVTGFAVVPTNVAANLGTIAADTADACP